MIKKALWWIGITAIGLLGLSNITHATSDVDVFRWAYDQGIVSFSGTLISSESTLQRQQFAPILLAFIDKVAKKDYEKRTCNARDLANVSSEYRSALETLCQYGILNGEAGSLYPYWRLTNGQAVALVMRIVDGRQDESTTGGRHWAQGYYERARQLGYQVSALERVKNANISYKNLINFLYSVAYPNTIITNSSTTTTNNGASEFSSSEDALKRLAEIMVS